MSVSRSIRHPRHGVRDGSHSSIFGSPFAGEQQYDPLARSVRTLPSGWYSIHSSPSSSRGPVVIRPPRSKRNSETEPESVEAAVRIWPSRNCVAAANDSLSSEHPTTRSLLSVSPGPAPAQPHAISAARGQRLTTPVVTRLPSSASLVRLMTSHHCDTSSQ